MSGVARAIGKIAGAVATVAAFIPGGQVIAGAAAAISAVSGTVAQLTAKPPTVQGSTTNVVIDPNSPTPYSMGRTYVGGHVIHDVGYGPADGDLENPYRSTFYIYSCAGPVQNMGNPIADFNTLGMSANGSITGHYSGHMWYDKQLGQTPEPAVLENSATFYGRHEEIPNWSNQHKLSGYAAGVHTYKLDKKGKIYGGGVPQHGIIGSWVKVYDPRQDSTYPGGQGGQRLDDEGTWQWSENPALHAATYAYGRYNQNVVRPKKIFGIGMAKHGIDWPQFVEAANTCDANGWKVGGTIYEPGDKWNNLKLIMQAGGMSPKWRGPILSCTYPSPKISLGTITIDDLAEGEWSVPGMQPWQNRINGVIPTYRSELHNWEQIPTSKVSIQALIDEDGEDIPEGVTWPLVQHPDQASQLAYYKIYDSRELGPIVLPLKPKFLDYGIGDAFVIDIPEMGLNHLCEIISDDFDPATGVVTVGFVTNTTGKHAPALARSGTYPATPTLLQDGELDNIREGYLAEQIADRIVTSTAFVDVQDQLDDQDDTLEQFGLSINSQGQIINQQGEDISNLGLSLNDQGQLINDQGIVINNIQELEANRDLILISQGAVTGIQYTDPATGQRVTAPHRIFWDAFELATSASSSNTPFLYDPVADVVYMDTAFIKDLSVETIHVRDGAISRIAGFEQISATGYSVGTWNQSSAETGGPIVISKGPGDGHAVFGVCHFEIGNSDNSNDLGVFFSIHQRRFSDPQLTQALSSYPGVAKGEGKGVVRPGERQTFTIAWVDDAFSDGEEFITYQLFVRRNRFSDSQSARAYEIAYSTLLAKK